MLMNALRSGLQPTPVAIMPVAPAVAASGNAVQALRPAVASPSDLNTRLALIFGIPLLDPTAQAGHITAQRTPRQRMPAGDHRPGDEAVTGKILALAEGTVLSTRVPPFAGECGMSPAAIPLNLVNLLSRMLAPGRVV